MNPEWRARFDRDGFAVIRGFFSEAEVAALRAALDRFVHDVAPRVDKAHVMYEDPSDPASLKQADCLHFEPEFDRLRTSGKVWELAGHLIGPVAPRHCEYFNKPPHNNKPTPPHQDGFYFCLEPNIACTVWIPLDPVDAENGTLSYVRGSHRLGVLPHRSTAVLGFSQGLIPDPAELGESVLCPAEPGDILVHHSLTVHSAGANRSARHRRSIGYVFYSAEAKLDEAAHERYQASLREQRESKGLEHSEVAAVR